MVIHIYNKENNYKNELVECSSITFPCSSSLYTYKIPPYNSLMGNNPVKIYQPISWNFYGSVMNGFSIVNFTYLYPTITIYPSIAPYQSVSSSTITGKNFSNLFDGNGVKIIIDLNDSEIYPTSVYYGIIGAVEIKNKTISFYMPAQHNNISTPTLTLQVSGNGITEKASTIFTYI